MRFLVTVCLSRTLKKFSYSQPRPSSTRSPAMTTALKFSPEFERSLKRFSNLNSVTDSPRRCVSLTAANERLTLSLSLNLIGSAVEGPVSQPSEMKIATKAAKIFLNNLTVSILRFKLPFFCADRPTRETQVRSDYSVAAVVSGSSGSFPGSLIQPSLTRILMMVL